jgi:hypothetical protein
MNKKNHHPIHEFFFVCFFLDTSNDKSKTCHSAPEKLSFFFFLDSYIDTTSKPSPFLLVSAHISGGGGGNFWLRLSSKKPSVSSHGPRLWDGFSCTRCMGLGESLKPLQGEYLNWDPHSCRKEFSSRYLAGTRLCSWSREKRASLKWHQWEGGEGLRYGLPPANKKGGWVDQKMVLVPPSESGRRMQSGEWKSEAELGEKGG